MSEQGKLSSPLKEHTRKVDYLWTLGKNHGHEYLGNLVRSNSPLGRDMLDDYILKSLTAAKAIEITPNGIKISDGKWRAAFLDYTRKKHESRGK